MSNPSSSDEVMKQNGYGINFAIPLFLLVGILLIGAFLRFYQLPAMNNMIAPDESVYGLDALSLLQNPRLTPFFPANYGREGGWMYWLAGWFSILGTSSSTMRIASAMIGLLTVAGTYRLAREIFGKQPALWVGVAIAIFYWHVHFSHLAFRAITFPLMGTLTFAFLWKAFNTNQRRFWIVAGIFLGMTLYTYFSARTWMIYAGFTLIGFYLYDRRLWRNIAWGALMAGVVSTPMLLYWVTYPDLAFQRFSGVAISGIDQLIPNIGEWFRMWTMEGDWFEHHNVPYRPVLDLPLAILAVSGLVGLLIMTWRKGMFLWVVGLLGVSAVGLLTTHANSLIRNIGSVIPMALMIGYGAWTIQRMGARWRVGWVFPASLLLWAGINSLTTVDQWLNVPALYTRMEQHIGGGMAYLRVNTPPDARLYFAPFSSSHPVLRFRSQSLLPRIVNGLDATVCEIIPDVPQAWYFSIVQWDANFASRLAQWGDVEKIYDEPIDARYAIYTLKPNLTAITSAEPILFGDKLDLRVLSTIPATINKNTPLTITIAMRRIGDIPDPFDTYTLFAHAYDAPMPVENVIVRAQLDAPLCPSTPPFDWRMDEWAVQTFTLIFPPDLAVGSYQLAMGVYVQPSFARLPIASASGDSFLLPIITLEE
ncbi:MAG: glycosyltransferase family 39 protein [bacterium]|nr:glycosyltransferase family 39 protein [bacterium]